MKKTFAIDLPFLCLRNELSFSVGESALLLHIMEAIKAYPCPSLVFRNEVFSMMNYEKDEMWLLCNAISSIESCMYDTKSEEVDFRSEPIMTDDRLPKAVNDELVSLLCKIHEDFYADNKIVHIVPASRWSIQSEKLQTTVDHNSLEHPVIRVCDKSDFGDYLKKCRPKLCQLKHDAFLHHFGEKLVSPFSAYNTYDTSAAETLLQQAYDNCLDNEEFPKYLFTWDSNHECYVEFRHSGQGQYHGMDVTDNKEYTRIPYYIKEQYRK